MKRFRNILSALLLLLSTSVMAQQGRVEAQLDSMTIYIGGQVGLNIRATYPANATAVLHQLTDTITKEVEIVDVFPADSAIINGQIEIMQRYIVTSFDSGLHYVPPIDILEFTDGQKVATQDFALNVVNPFQNIAVDPQSQSMQFFDVKDAMDAPFVFAELLEYFPWAIVALLAIALIVVAIIFYRRHLAKQKGVVVEKPKHVDPCDVVALSELARIKEEKLWQRNQFKEYYSDITDTLRRYVSERYSVNALESTTDETMESLKDALRDDKVNQDRLRQILEEADFVKFAKYEPLPDENDMAIKHAIEFVESTRITVQFDNAKQ